MFKAVARLFGWQLQRLSDRLAVLLVKDREKKYRVLLNRKLRRIARTYLEPARVPKTTSFKPDPRCFEEKVIDRKCLERALEEAARD